MGRRRVLEQRLSTSLDEEKKRIQLTPAHAVHPTNRVRNIKKKHLLFDIILKKRHHIGTTSVLLRRTAESGPEPLGRVQSRFASSSNADLPATSAEPEAGESHQDQA
jgi:hypothetical protein